MHGGRDILEKFRFAGTFRQMIYNQFGVQVNVELVGGKPVSTEKFDAMGGDRGSTAGLQCSARA